MNYLDIYVIIIFIVKICFIILSLLDKFLKLRDYNPNTINLLHYLKDRLELLFKLLMSLFLIYMFYPYRKKPLELDFESRLLLYLFGFVLIITANWHLILEDSIYYLFKKKNKN